MITTGKTVARRATGDENMCNVSISSFLWNTAEIWLKIINHGMEKNTYILRQIIKSCEIRHFATILFTIKNAPRGITLRELKESGGWTLQSINSQSGNLLMANLKEDLTLKTIWKYNSKYNTFPDFAICLFKHSCRPRCSAEYQLCILAYKL